MDWIEALRERTRGDARRFEALLALALARLPGPDLAAVERGADPAARGLAREERRLRKGRGPSASRVRLANRLLDAPALDEEALRALVDEAAFGDWPRDLIGRWLAAEVLDRARSALGPAFALLDPPGEVPAALVESASAYLDALQTEGPSAPVPDALAEVPILGAALARALDLRFSTPSSALRALAKAAAKAEPRIVVPFLRQTLVAYGDWDRRKTVRFLLRPLSGAESGSWALAALLLEPGHLDVPRHLLLGAAGRFEGTGLAAAIWCSLWSHPGEEREHWWALGEMREAGALSDAMLCWRSLSVGMSMYLDFVLPERAGAVRGLIRIVTRQDGRLTQLRLEDSFLPAPQGPSSAIHPATTHVQPRSSGRVAQGGHPSLRWGCRGQSPPAGGAFQAPWGAPPPTKDAELQWEVWRNAVWFLPGAAVRWGQVSEAGRAVARALERSLADGAPAEEIRALAVAAARLGNDAGLHVLLGMLDEGLGYDLALALGGLGPAARAAAPRLRALDDPWAAFALGCIEPDEPAWARRLADHLSTPEEVGRPAHFSELYHEGLITHGELSAQLALLEASLSIWERHPTDADVQRAVGLVLGALPAETAAIDDLRTRLRAIREGWPEAGSGK